MIIDDVLNKIRKLEDDQKKLNKYPLLFNLLPTEGYSFNCAVWTKKILREINIKLLDHNSIMDIMYFLYKNKTNVLWFYFKYYIHSLSLIFDSPAGYVKMNSDDKIKELKKKFNDYKNYIK